MEGEEKEVVKEYIASITEQPTEGPSKDDVKTIDLSKPIDITDSTEIMIKGKKCVLMPHPETGQLCAYPVVSNTNQGKIYISVIVWYHASAKYRKFWIHSPWVAPNFKSGSYRI